MAENRIAIVTGAGRGIGRGCALALADKGWTIVVNYRSNAGTAGETIDLVKARGGQGLAIQADVGSPSDRNRLVDETVQHYGRVDLLVNNAGIGPRKRLSILETSEESFDEVLGTNLKGPFFLTQVVARTMIRQVEEGHVPAPIIINISSISAYTSSPNRGEYCISKAGLSMMTQLFADQLAPHGINVYEIRPGIIETDLTSGVKEKYDRLILEEGITPIRRWGQPEDIGKAVVALAEGAFPFSTGEIFNVDGGFHMHRL